MSGRCVLALDEGSTSARAVLVDEAGLIVAEARNPLVPRFPAPGWVEFDPVALWRSQLDAVHRVMAQAGVGAADVAAIGITTHRESAVVWDRRTGEPVHDAVMWMSKQTDPIVRAWSDAGLDALVRARTGVNNDSYFSAGKLAWLLDLPGVRERALRGELAAGTVDTWLLWNLTGGRSHLTDTSEASRTALMDLATLTWDPHLCEACGVPPELLPPVVASDARFGEVERALLGSDAGPPVPVTAVLADQQAGMFGQACFSYGSVKNTYGTASVLTAHCGDGPVVLDGLTSSVAWTVDGETAFEAEGVVFSCGQTLQWLRERLGLFSAAEDVEALARRAVDNAGVYLVPAFAGLCAPHWDREARAAIVGLTLESGVEHVVRAGVEAMAYQVRDNIDALVAGGIPVPELKVDGGAARNDLLCQFQADIAGIPIVRPHQLERTALGVAYLAGAGVGLWEVPTDVERSWTAERVFEPAMSADRREALYAGWQRAVRSVRESAAEAAAAPGP